MAQTKAWTYSTAGYPQCLRQTSQPAPSVGSPTQILVRNRAVALNPVDIQFMNMGIWSLPFYPFAGEKGICEDFAGTVISAGAESGVKEGDEVFGISLGFGKGMLAEVTTVDTKAGLVLKKPATWSWEQAAALPLVWLTARTTIESVKDYVENGPHKKLVVLGGSSSTGMYVVHIAQQRGWRVMATCSGKNAEFVKSMGADEVTDYTQTDVVEAVKRFGPDAIIDCVGGVDTLNLTKRYVTIVGDKTSRASMGGMLTYLWNPQMVLRWLLGYLGLARTAYAVVNLDLNRSWLEEVLDLPTEKIIIDSTFPFDRVMDALERLNTGRAKGKVIIEVPS